MSTSTVDPYSERRRSALDRANDIRLARADLKHRIASGEVFAASVILDPPTEAQTWAIGDLVMSQHRWGRARMIKLLSRLMVSETKAAGALTDRQRRKLARALGQPAKEDA